MAEITASGRDYSTPTYISLSDANPVAITIEKPATYFALRELTGNKKIFVSRSSDSVGEFPLFPREIASVQFQQSPRGGQGKSYTLGYVRSDEFPCSVAIIIGYE